MLRILDRVHVIASIRDVYKSAEVNERNEVFWKLKYRILTWWLIIYILYFHSVLIQLDEIDVKLK